MLQYPRQKRGISDKYTLRWHRQFTLLVQRVCTWVIRDQRFLNKVQILDEDWGGSKYAACVDVYVIEQNGSVQSYWFISTWPRPKVHVLRDTSILIKGIEHSVKPAWLLFSRAKILSRILITFLNNEYEWWQGLLKKNNNKKTQSKKKLFFLNDWCTTTSQVFPSSIDFICKDSETISRPKKTLWRSGKRLKEIYYCCGINLIYMWKNVHPHNHTHQYHKNIQLFVQIA